MASDRSGAIRTQRIPQQVAADIRKRLASGR